MKKLIFSAILAITACLCGNAQFYGIDVDKLAMLFGQASPKTTL